MPAGKTRPDYPTRGLQRRADGRSGIVRSSVYVDGIERPVALQPAVGNTIECDSTAVDQAGFAGRPLQPARECQQGILGSPLQRRRDIGEAGIRGRFIGLDAVFQTAIPNPPRRQRGNGPNRDLPQTEAPRKPKSARPWSWT